MTLLFSRRMRNKASGSILFVQAWQWSCGKVRCYFGGSWYHPDEFEEI
jgi:hypothetical protein